jgi:hypothetical protein
MKILMLRNVYVNVDKPRLKEVWSKYLSRNDTYSIDKIEDISDDVVNLVLDNGDVLLEVPRNSFKLNKYESS